MPLRLLILTAARSGEIRLADRSELDREKRLWSIPAHRMKANRDHIVHLSDKSVALLGGVAGPGNGQPRDGCSIYPETRC